MKRCLKLIMVCCLGVFVMVGCNKKDTNVNDTPNTNQESTNEDGNTLEGGDNNTEVTDSNVNDKGLIDTLTNLFAKPGLDADEYLGESIVEKNEAGEVTNRTYANVPFLGEEVEVSVGYDQGNCFNVNAMLSGTDYQVYKDALVAAIGEPTEEGKEGDAVEEGSGAKNTIWLVNGRAVTLLEAYGSISLSVN